MESFRPGRRSLLTVAHSANIVFLFAGQFLISGSTDTFNSCGGREKNQLWIGAKCFFKVRRSAVKSTMLSLRGHTHSARVREGGREGVLE